MTRLEMALEEMTAAVLDSPEYKEYDLQRNRVKEVPGLKARIDEFRERNFLLQISDDNAFDKMEQFEKEYSNFREEPLVSEFLAAELAFCRMMQDINLHLTEAVHFE